MAGLTQIDWQAAANEAQVRALLEDFVSQYTVPVANQLALAVWFDKSPGAGERKPYGLPRMPRFGLPEESAGPGEHKLLMLFTGPEMNNIESELQPLLWKAGVQGPPFIKIHWTSAKFFSQQLRLDPSYVQQYFPNAEVIYFQKRSLTQDILDAFQIVTEPSHLIKVWCLSQEEYTKGQTIQSLPARWGGIRRELGIVKTWESPDFQTCKAIVHLEIRQQWLPSSPEGVRVYGFYAEWTRGRPGYFLAEGGALYSIEKFEVIYAPDYASLVLERRPDDRYLEVYLRAVHPPEQPAT